MIDDRAEEQIRRRAYELWEREGSPDGRAEDFWAQAELSVNRGGDVANINGNADKDQLDDVVP